MYLALIIDILIIVLHIKFGQYRLFNLDNENNIPTLYQGFKLFCISLFCLIPIITAYIKREPIKRLLTLWIPFCVIFTWLSLDELGQFHENSKQFIEEIAPQITNNYTSFFTNHGYSSTEWVIMYIPFFIIFLIYLIYAVKYLVKKYGFKIWIPSLAGVTLYIGVILLEIIGMDKTSLLSYDKAILLEESFEMVGTTLIGITFSLIAITDIQRARSKDPSLKYEYSLTTKVVKTTTLGLIIGIAILGYKISEKPPAVNNTASTNPVNIYIPSREPRDECAWKEELRSRLGIKFFFEDCAGKINIFVRTDTVYAIPEEIQTGGKISEYRQIDVLQKPEDQPIQDTIYVKYIETLPLEQKEACKVIKEDYQLQGNDIYRIFPDLEFAKNSHLAQYISCGAYSITESNGFFIYNPNKKQKYLYVYEDRGIQVIDKETIEIL